MSANKRLKLSRMAPSRQSTGSAIVRFYDPDVQAKDALGRTQEQILAWSNSQLEHSHNYIQVLFPLPEGSPFNWSAPVIDLDTAKAFRTNSKLRQQLRRSFERMLTFYGFITLIDPEPKSGNKEDIGVPDEAIATHASTTLRPIKEITQNAQASSVADEHATELQAPEEVANAASTSVEDLPSRSAIQASPHGYYIVPGENWREASRNWCVRFDHNHLRITRILRCLRVLGLQNESKAFFDALKRVYNEPAVGIGARSLEFWTRAVERPLHLPPDDMEDKCEWLKAWEEELGKTE
ncbi:hypothetical protein SVAN01_02648 [Stagonosporopsis vannaccii]|nr:hypothetical protein SVAN01_02648 [Stagonosporopsis vannaccii]